MTTGTRYGGGHAPGRGRRGAAEFPAAWSRDELVEIIEDVARDPDETPVMLPHGRWYAVGLRRGVRVVALLDPGGPIRAGFPVDGPGVVHNPDRAPDPARPTVTDLADGRAGIAAAALVDELAGRLPASEAAVCRRLLDAGEWHELALLLAAAVPEDERTTDQCRHLAVLA